MFISAVLFNSLTSTKQRMQEYESSFWGDIISYIVFILLPYPYEILDWLYEAFFKAFAVNLG